jgi:sn-glycerol 3-phosphate transport system substrate-binding protein
MRTTRRLGAPLLLAAALLAAGCGSGTSGTDDAGVPDGTDSDGQTVATDLPPCPVGALADAGGPVDIRVWFQLGGKTRETLEAQVAKYNASQDKVVVHAENQGASYEELLRKYESGIPSKDLPDLLVAEDTATQFLADSGTVLPAQSCLDAEGMDTDGYVQTAVDHYSVDGALYPASANLSNILTYYNKNHFRRAGLDPEEPPTTLAEVRADAEKIKAAGIVDQPVIIKLDSWFIETQLTGEKVPVVDNDNGFGSGETTQGVFDNEQTNELFTWLRDMNADGLLQPVPATEGQVSHYLAMAAQKGSITVETSTSATSIKAFLGGDTDVAGVDAGPVDVTALDFGAGEVFGVDGPGKAQIGGGVWFLTNTNPDVNQSAAWDFMKWWNEVDQQVTWNLDGSYLPFVTATVDDPRVKAYWTDDLAGRWLAIAYDQMVEGVNPDFTGPRIGPYDKFREAMRQGMDSLMFEGADPAAAVTTANDKTTAAIEDYNDANF